MAYNSRITYTGVTGTTFSYGGIILLNDRLVTEQSQLVVTVNGVSYAYNAGAPGAAEYTLNKNTRVMTIGTALITTDTLLIRRSTKKDARHVDFTNNSPLTEADLDLITLQLLFIAQEASETQDLQRSFDFGGMVVGYHNGDYILTLKASYTFDISAFITRTSSGTVTAKLQIDGIDVGGSSHGAGGVEISQILSSANRVLTGQTLKIVLSSASAIDTFDFYYTISAQEV